MSLEQNKAVIRRYIEELYTAADLDVADEIIHQKTRNPRGGKMWSNGPESVKQAITREHSLGRDLRREIQDLVAEDNKVVVYSTITGTHPSSGASLSNTGVATFVIEDGKIVEEPWSCWSFAGIASAIARATARRWIARSYDSGDLSAADALIGVGFVLHDTHAPDVAGIDAMKRLVRQMRTAFPDLAHTIEDIVAEGDRVVVRWVARGTHHLEFLGIAPTGRRVALPGVSIYRLDDGRFPSRIEEEWRFWDPPAALQ